MRPILGLMLLASAVLGQMQMPMPMQMPMQMQMQMPSQPLPPPPPYNMYGPISPYAQGPAMAPPIPPYPASTTVSYSGYPVMAPAAAAPYPAYGMPPPPPAPPAQPVMYPPPYQTFSGPGPMGDPFTTTTGICKYSGSRYNSPVAPLFNGIYKQANMGMICTRYS